MTCKPITATEEKELFKALNCNVLGYEVNNKKFDSIIDACRNNPEGLIIFTLTSNGKVQWGKTVTVTSEFKKDLKRMGLL
jgi:hypothetical protein